jgi:hypothetical protein
MTIGVSFEPYDYLSLATSTAVVIINPYDIVIIGNKY